MQASCEARSVAEDIVDNHSRVVCVPNSKLPVLRERMLRQCIELYHIYDQGLAATFGRLNELAQYEQDLLQKRLLLKETTLPVIRGMYSRHLKYLEERVHSAVRAIDASLKKVEKQISALTESPQVKSLQRRAEKCMQPVFLDEKITEQQLIALKNPELRRLVCNGEMLSSQEPRVELTEETGNSAIAAINRCFGVKHLHRKCRVAAPLHSIKDLLWHVVSVDLHPGVTRALALYRSKVTALHGGTTIRSGIPMERLLLIGGDTSPTSSASNGESVVTIPRVCIKATKTHWRASEWPIPKCISFGEPEMLGMGGHAKSICFRTLQFEAPQSEVYSVLVIGKCRDAVEKVFSEHSNCRVEPVPNVDISMQVRDIIGLCAVGICQEKEHSEPMGAFESDKIRLLELPDGNIIGAMSGLGSDICELLLHSDRAEDWTADVAELWAPMTERAARLKRIQIRAPRVGDLKRDGGLSKPDMRWYEDYEDARYMIPGANKGWTDRAIITWKEILKKAGCPSRANCKVLCDQKDRLRDAVLTLSEPLRWHVARIVQTMHESVDLPPIQCAETAPSSFSKTQQLELVSACFWFHHASDDAVRAECARMLRIFHFQIGRYASVSECGDGPVRTEKRKRIQNQSAWREAKKTCARTLNCDHPDARPARLG